MSQTPPAARAAPVHAAMTQFPLVDGGNLLVNGLLLTRLAERVGSTPFYAYDRGLLRARVAELRAALPASVELHYAMKANPMPAVVAVNVLPTRVHGPELTEKVTGSPLFAVAASAVGCCALIVAPTKFTVWSSHVK